MKYDYKQIAKCKISNKNYEVLLVNDEYYQIRVNRKKITNSHSEKAAIKRMLSEANYNETSLFEQPTETEKEILGKIVILDYSKIYGWILKLNINEEEAHKIIDKYNLKKDESIGYLDSWLPIDRWNKFNNQNENGK